MFFDRYDKLCRGIGSSSNAIAKELKIGSATVTGWKNDAVPEIKTVIKVADRFGVSVDYLLGNTDKKEKPAAQGDGLNEMEEKLRVATAGYSQEQWDKLLEHAELLAAAQRLQEAKNKKV